MQRASRAWRRSGTTSASRIAAGERPHAEAGARIARARAAAPDLRQRHGRDGHRPRARALLSARTASPRRTPRACSWRASAASARATCSRCAAGIASAAASRSRPSRSPSASASRQLVEQEWDQPVALADLAVRGDDLMAAGLRRGARRRGDAAAAARGGRGRPVAERARDAAALAVAPESID